MSDHQSFQRFAALAAIISFPLALGNIVLSGMPWISIWTQPPTQPFYVILAPIWARWLGIDLLRKPVQIA